MASRMGAAVRVGAVDSASGVVRIGEVTEVGDGDVLFPRVSIRSLLHPYCMYMALPLMDRAMALSEISTSALPV